jgi:hypothetical protein
MSAVNPRRSDVTSANASIEAHAFAVRSHHLGEANGGFAALTATLRVVGISE